jgi:hypothetical protein
MPMRHALARHPRGVAQNQNMLCLKRQQGGLRMKREEFPGSDGICLFSATGAPHKHLLFNNKWSEHVYFNQISRDLAWILITKGQSEYWAAIPPKRIAVRNLLKVANGLVSFWCDPTRGEALAA